MVLPSLLVLFWGRHPCRSHCARGGSTSLHFKIRLVPRAYSGSTGAIWVASLLFWCARSASKRDQQPPCLTFPYAHAGIAGTSSPSSSPLKINSRPAPHAPHDPEAYSRSSAQDSVSAPNTLRTMLYLLAVCSIGARLLR